MDGLVVVVQLHQAVADLMIEQPEFARLEHVARAGALQALGVGLQGGNVVLRAVGFLGLAE